MKRFPVCAMAAVFAAFLFAGVGCSGDDASASEGTIKENPQDEADTSEQPDDTPQSEKDPPAAGSTLSLNFSELTLVVGDSVNLSATDTVTWDSSDKAVATVSAGRVEATGEGSTVITATSTADATKSATCKLTVLASSISYTVIDAWNFVNQTEADYSSLGTETTKSDGTTSLSAVSLSSDISVVGDSNALTLVLSKSKTGAGKSNSNPSYKYRADDGLCIKGAALKIDGVQAKARLTIAWRALGSTSRNLEVTIGSESCVETEISGTGDQEDYVTTFDSSSSAVTIYIGASNELYIRSIKIEEIGESSANGTVLPSGISLTSSSLMLDLSADTKTATLTATISNAGSVSSGYDTIKWKSSDESVATVANGTVTAVGAGSTTITAYTVNGKTAECSVIVSSGKFISLADTPVGYASLETSYRTSGTQTEVSTRTELIEAVKNGGIIVINGMIDMSDGMMPQTAGGSTTALDAFVKAKTTSLNASDSSKYPKVFETYKAFAAAYANLCSKSTDDKSKSSTATTLSQTLWALNAAYGAEMKLNLVSNTTLVGKTPNSGIKGGSIQINGLSNVQVRNLTIQDAYDPFPHHESNDGFNAEWDCIVVQGASKNIWIDHCTMEDTIWAGTAANGEKWQTYDGLCDMKNDSTNITVSNCLFKNHDKTMLIGSSDDDGDNSKRFISLIGNYFYNCGQRLPMVRNTTLHVLNNYYDASSPHYAQSYAVGVRQDAIIYAENNYFGSGINQSFANSYGKLYSSGNTDNSKSGCKSTVTGSTLFSSAVKVYAYTALSAADAKTNAQNNAGAGYVFR